MEEILKLDVSINDASVFKASNLFLRWPYKYTVFIKLLMTLLNLISYMTEFHLTISDNSLYYYM